MRAASPSARARRARTPGGPRRQTNAPAVLAVGNSSTPQIIKRLVEKLVHVVFSPGDFALQEGDQGTEMYFVAQGAAAVVVHKVQVAVLYAGDCFGEIALLLPKVVRTASVVARSFCEAYKLSVADFQFCLADFPDIQARMRTIAHERLAELKANEESSKGSSQTRLMSSGGLQRQNSISFADIVMRASSTDRRSQTRRRSGEISGEIDIPVSSAFDLIARRPSDPKPTPPAAPASDGGEASTAASTLEARGTGMSPGTGTGIGAKPAERTPPERKLSTTPVHSSASTDRTDRSDRELSA